MRRRLASQRWAVVLVTAAALTSAACGARWSEDQQAAVLARSEGRGGASTDAGSASSDEPGASASDGAGAASGGSTSGGGTGAASSSGASGGTGKAAASPSGPRPCDAPSDAPGITAKNITLGTISTESGPVPGLGSTALAAARAYVAYRNSVGGVCGRQLALRTADDGADNGRHRAAVNDMATKVIGLAGGVGGGDAGSADAVTQLEMPVTTVAISDPYQAAATVFDINPPLADVHKVIGKYKYLLDTGAKTVALVYPATDQTRAEMQSKHKPLMEAAGIKVVLEHEFPLSTLSFDSSARAVANSKADYMFFLSEVGMSAGMAKSMYDTGYKLKFQEYITYDPKFIELAGKDAAEGVTAWIRNLPNEEPNSNPEQQQFLRWMDRTSPGVTPDTFAAESWAGVKAMVDALHALPGPITRKGLLAQLRATETFDAGGFVGAILLGKRLSNGCQLAMIVEGGKWRRLTPSKGFLC
jgi:ABC-type branched-subunit amino acid transport system substrate-binding protein